MSSVVPRPELPKSFLEVIDDLLPFVRPLAKGEYAVSVGGSIGKGTFDHRSDIDLRLFCQDTIEKGAFNVAMETLEGRIGHWRDRGIEVDGCWVRRTGEVQSQLKDWVGGTQTPLPIVWTIWGYYLPTDIYNQYIIEDNSGILQRWQSMLNPYPPALKNAIVQQHSRSLRYWTSDYHFQNKVARGDYVFLASMAPRLVHDMVQILYALGETYYPGDGKNLELLPACLALPERFAVRVREALYPGVDNRAFERQYQTLIELAKAVLEIAATGVAPTDQG